jgi:hypothetical protein
VEGPEPADGEEEEAQAAEAQAEVAEGADTGRSEGGAKWAEANKRQRGQAFRWLTANPLADVFLMKAVLLPLESYMAEELAMASGAWQSQQWALAAMSSGNLSFSN